MKAINDKLDQLLPLKETIDGIEDALQVLRDLYDNALTRTEQNEREVKELKKKVGSVGARVTKVAPIIDDLDDLEWRNRRLNLEFHGIPDTDNEDLLDKVNALTAKNKLSALTESDVVTVHRLPAKRDKTAGIICPFTRQADRDAWWLNRKKMQETNGKIFIL